MNFIQKIYFNDKPLVLTTDCEAFINENPAASNYTLFHSASIKNFKQAQQQLETPGSSGCIIEDDSETILSESLNDMYQLVIAAGGAVFNEQGALLLIFRKGKWDLPKGKLDEGETIETCAVREVIEETGLKTITLNKKIGNTYHIYLEKNAYKLKRSDWYNMTGTSAEKLKPQKEESIMEARWVFQKDIGFFASKSYEAIRDVLRQIEWIK